MGNFGEQSQSEILFDYQARLETADGGNGQLGTLFESSRAPAEAGRERVAMVRTSRAWSKRFWGWVALRKLEAEFLLELDEHVELLTAEYMRRGESPEQAKRMARIQVGGRGQLRDEYLERAGLPMVESLVADLRFALRALRKRPGFAGVCILTLALGIGATTAIFSVVNGVLLRPLPYPNSERLLRIQESHPGWSNGHVTYAAFLDTERESKTITNIAAFRPWDFNLTGEGEPQQLPGAMVSGKFFAAMGTIPVIGRTLNEQDDLNGSDNHVVVLSYGLWQSTFGGDPQILNRILHISAERYRVLGVMPKGFEYPEHAKLWCPLVAGGESRGNRRAHLLTVIGNVEPKDAVKAGGELLRIARDVNQNNPGIDPEIVLMASPLQKTLVAPVQPALLILISAVSLLLLLACASLANLLLGQGEARRKEFAIRISIGARRRRLVRQLLTESVLLSLLGAVAGVGIAWQSLRLISALQLDDIPRIGEISMDWRVLGFTALISLLAGILFGLAPAIVATKTDVHSTLK